MVLDRTKGKRSRRGEAFWRRAVSEQRQSGLSGQEFCRREGFAKSTFYQWQRRLKSTLPESEESPAHREFVAVEIRQESADVGEVRGSDSFELIFTNGLRLKIPSHVESRALARVLNAIEGTGRC